MAVNGLIQHRSVADVMTKIVISATPDTPFKAIVKLLEDNRIGAMPVVTPDARVVGIVSESDLLLKESGPDESGLAIFGRRQRRTERDKAETVIARDLMTAPAVTIGSKASLPEAARVMQTNRVKHLPVVDSDRLVGIVSRGDILKVFLRSDSEIRAEIIGDLMQRTLWMDPARVKVRVESGNVAFDGVLDRRSDVGILCAMTSRLDGVVSVTSDLVFEWDDRKHPPAREDVRTPEIVRL